MMVSTAIGNMLPFAFGVAFSPIPIIAVILVLATPKGRTNSFAFIFGWISGSKPYLRSGHPFCYGTQLFTRQQTFLHCIHDHHIFWALSPLSLLQILDKTPKKRRKTAGSEMDEKS